MKDKHYKIVIILLLFGVIVFSLALFVLWKEVTNSSPVVTNYHYVPSDRSFIRQPEGLSDYGFEEYIEEKIINERNRLIRERKDFLNVDLKKMEITLYEEGEIRETFPLLSKGREGSWWETAPGAYFVGDKLANHFSSIAEAWMPYAIQFYGNFFIHGWPYDSMGRPLAAGPSGGCIRMNTVDAQKLFEFAERGMPILVYEEKTHPPLPEILQEGKEEMDFPKVEAENFIVADLHTGEILLSKNIDSEIYAGPLVDVMIALSASEVINLGRRIVVQDWMFEGKKEGDLIPGWSYSADELVNYLLRESSTEAAFALSRFFTPEYFTMVMNAKARAVGMEGTSFYSIIKEDKNNITTLIDTAKLMRYISNYRGFLFHRANIFESSLNDESGFLLAVQNAEDRAGNSRVIMTAVYDSENTQEDFENIINWIKESLDLHIM